MIAETPELLQKRLQFGFPPEEQEGLDGRIQIAAVVRFFQTRRENLQCPFPICLRLIQVAVGRGDPSRQNAGAGELADRVAIRAGPWVRGSPNSRAF